MTRLITQILDMSMLQSNKGMVLSRSTFDLVGLLSGAVDDTNFSYPGGVVSLDTPPFIRINADRDRLSQVLSNLLSNARQHGTPGQPIAVFAREAETFIEFGVTNRGYPIPEEMRADLFKPLKPALALNPRNRTGLGLGLYIAHEIAKAHGGELRFSCSEGFVTFTVVISRP